MSLEAAAGQLGCPIGTVGVRLLRAKERLKTRLTSSRNVGTGRSSRWRNARAVKPGGMYAHGARRLNGERRDAEGDDRYRLAGGRQARQ